MVDSPAVELSDYFCAGYRLIKQINRREDMPGELLPPHVISDSNCVGMQFPDSWCIEWASSQDELHTMANAIGIKEEEVHNVFEWSAGFPDLFGWPGVFYDLDSAKKTKKRFFGPDGDIVATGFGVHKSLFDVFTRELTPPPPEPGYAPVGESGYLICLKRRETLASDGVVLGFELREISLSSPGCSWLCNGLENDLFDRFSITPNEYGFISDFYVANIFCNEINSGKISAEPGFWLPWLMVRYD